MVTAGVIAWCTLLALTAPRRLFVLGALRFLCGFVLNELPFTVLFLLLASTLPGIGADGPGSPADWAAAGLTVLAAAGLAVVAWRGLRAGPAVDRALRDGLGAGTAARPRRLPLARIVFVPFWFRRRDVVRVANISYGDAGRKNLLDVYRHRGRPAGGPILGGRPSKGKNGNGPVSGPSAV